MPPSGPSKAKPAPFAGKQDPLPVAGQEASQSVNPSALTAVIDKEKELAAEKQGDADVQARHMLADPSC